MSVTPSATATASKSVHQSSLAALTLGALGVVYGDIGTSVLYALKEVFATGLIAFTPDNVLGILSLLVWTLTSIVSFKYVTLVLRADNHGEGGLTELVRRGHRVRYTNDHISATFIFFIQLGNIILRCS